MHPKTSKHVVYMETFNNATYGLSNPTDLSRLIGGDLAPSLSGSHHLPSQPAHSSLTDNRLVFSVYCVVSISGLQGFRRPSHCCGVAWPTFFAFSLLIHPTTGSKQPGPSLAHSSLARYPQPRLVFQRSHRTWRSMANKTFFLLMLSRCHPIPRRPCACAGPTYTQKASV